jgi:Sad1 / UNC-like C-terminal
MRRWTARRVFTRRTPRPDKHRASYPQSEAGTCFRRARWPRHRFVVVELCEDLRIDTAQLANFEFFSGMFKEFTVSVAKKYAATEAEGWRAVGTYVGKNVRDVQVSSFYLYPSLGMSGQI